MLGHAMPNMAGNVPGSCVAATWRVWKPTRFTQVSENGCQGPVGLRYLFKGRFGEAQLLGVLLGIPNNPKFFGSFVALGVHTPVQISAGGEKLVWFVYQILLCWIVTVQGWNLCVLIFILYLCYIYITRFINPLPLMRVGVHPSPLCF